MRSPWLGQVRIAQPPVRSLLLAGRRRLAGSVTALTDDTFAQVKSAPKAIVDFWSPGCSYCVAFKPIFEEVAAQSNNGIAMYTMNIDENQKVFAGFNAKYLPTVIFFQNGQEVHREEGSMDKASFVGAIGQTFGTSGLPAVTPGQASAPQTVVSAPSSSGGTWLALGGLAAAGLMGYLILKS